MLIEGAYGVGKTRFLGLIKPKKLMPVGLESLDNKHEILASILQGLDYESIASHWRTSAYLKKICRLSGFFIVIDEANDLDRRVWPYFKRIIDAGIPMVLAGLPNVRTYLASEHPDILSRLKVLTLFPIIVKTSSRSTERAYHRKPSSRYTLRPMAICASLKRSAMIASIRPRN